MGNRPMLAFAATSTILLAVMAMAGLQNQSREHRRFQQEFQRLTTDRSSAHASGPRDALDVLQIWLPPFDRTDRCVTCHLGVAEPELRGAALPFGYHSEVAHAPADFNRIGCVSCHAGQGAATTLQEAHGRSGHWAYPLLEGTHIEGRCGRCHLSSAVREAPSLTRGRSLIQRFGCFNCHTAGGRETFPPTAPPLDGLSLKVSRDWLHRWLKNPKAMDRNARMPDFHLTSREIAALSEYLLSLPPHEGVEAAIRRAGIESHGDPAEGARLFRTSRCISCHTLEGKGHGGAPDLSQIGSKTSKAWLLAFMKDTHALNPQTAMPSFALSPAQLRDIVSYMKDDLRDFDAPAQQVVQGPVQTGLVTEGRRVFIRYGCSACHGRREVQHEELGPDLSSVGDGKATSVDFGARRDLPRTLPAWLKAKVTEPRSFGPDLKMPSFALSDGELSDMTAALMSLSKEHVPEEFKQRTYWTVTPAVRPPPGDVGRLFAKYRCLACHLIGDEGTDLSTAPLTFQGSKTKREWLAQYLLLPETIYPLLTERMPVLGMTPEEAKQIADFISTVYVEDGIGGERVLTRGPAEANGARLFRDKGCRSCHIVGQTGGYVGPPLSAAGDRLQGAWIAFWLENPQRWRRQARCPNYGLSQEEVGDLTAFLSSQTAGAHRP